MNNKIKAGFTLIELLIAVLIISILATVAVSQYKMATLKSEMSKYLPLARSIVQAEEQYYYVTGTYTMEAHKLDILLPHKCTALPYSPKDTSIVYYCDNNIWAHFTRNEGGSFILDYCPNHKNIWKECAKNRQFQLQFFYAHSTQPNKKNCLVLNNSARGTKFCNNFNKLFF